jgi:channel protein (hemolysin III family)
MFHSPLPIPGFADPFSSLSHLVAAGVVLVLGLVFLVRNPGGFGRTLGVSVFIFGAVFLLSMSGVYHLLEPGTGGRAVLQRLDHAAIFVLIAATFTPVHLLLFRGIARWGMLLLIWASAITGLTLKTVFFTQIPDALGVSLYLGLGWVGAISAYLLYRRCGLRPLVPVIIGALAYTLGAVLDFAAYPVLVPGVIGAHEIFHVLVLVGIAAHWRFIRDIAIDSPAPLTAMLVPAAETA